MTILDAIRHYSPENEQEERDREQIISWLQSRQEIFSRQCAAAHMTASAWVVSPDRSKVLMVYHNLYDSWSWMGGHADGERNLFEVAAREVKEESGIKNLRPLSEDIFSLEILSVDGHIKHGKYVSTHLHLNVTYLFEADCDQQLSIKPDENSGVAWFTVEEVPLKTSEPWFRDHIYSKLISKVIRTGL